MFKEGGSAIVVTAVGSFLRLWHQNPIELIWVCRAAKLNNLIARQTQINSWFDGEPAVLRGQKFCI
jgi:hypothetical protein